MAVSVVAGDAAIEPDDGLHAKIVGEHLFIGGAIHGRIALLGGGEQAFLGGEQRAAAIDVDRSAFEHDAVFALRLKERMHDSAAPAALRHAPAIFFVELVIRILCPCIELKVQSEQSGGCG